MVAELSEVEIKAIREVAITKHEEPIEGEVGVTQEVATKAMEDTPSFVTLVEKRGTAPRDAHQQYATTVIRRVIQEPTAPTSELIMLKRRSQIS